MIAIIVTGFHFLYHCSWASKDHKGPRKNSGGPNMALNISLDPKGFKGP